MKKITALVLSLLLWGGLQAQAQHRLRLQVQEGRSQSYTLTQNTLTHMSVMGRDITTRANISADLELKIQATEDTCFTLTAQYTRLEVEVKAPLGQGQTYSSQGKDSLARACRSLTHKPFTARVSLQGKVLDSVTAPTHFLDGLEGPLSFYASKKRQTYRESLSAYGAPFMKSLLERIFKTFPAQAVALNQDWETPAQDGPNGMNGQTTQRLTAAGAKGYTLEGSSLATASEPIHLKDTPVSLQNARGEGQSTYQLDPNGWTREGHSTHTITGEMEMQGTTLPLKIEVEIIVKTLP